MLKSVFTYGQRPSSHKAAPAQIMRPLFPLDTTKSLTGRVLKPWYQFGTTLEYPTNIETPEACGGQCRSNLVVASRHSCDST